MSSPVGRRRDDDFLRAAAVDVRARFGGVGEEAGRFDDDVDAEVLPRQLARVALGQHLDRAAVDRDRRRPRRVTVAGDTSRSSSRT